MYVKDVGRMRVKLHLEETEASGIEAVFSFPILQREKPYKLVNKLWVREIFKDDLFTLSDTQTNTRCNNSNTEASLSNFVCGTVLHVHTPHSSPHTAGHLVAFQKLHRSSFL